VDAPQLHFGIMLSRIMEAVKGSLRPQSPWCLEDDQFMRDRQTRPGTEYGRDPRGQARTLDKKRH